MSIISAVRDYLKMCPLFENIPIAVDYLASSPTEAAIDSIPVPHVIKSYTDGSSLCYYQFSVAMRFPWYGDESNGLKCSEWFENFSEWLENMSCLKILPELPLGLTPLKIEALPNRFGYDGKNSSARYQLICNLTFLKERMI